MTSTIFGRIGPYAIERPIGQGGMASVFLARDTRINGEAVAGRPHAVALKVVHLGSEDDEEAREILEAERRGAELQERFSATSRFVPRVFESGFTDNYFYIAMEYVAGEDLAQAIHRGPLPWERAAAIGIQLCEFLEEAYRFEAATGTESRRVLLHNDLKPRNIRLADGDTIRVLDFGAAKALSLTRKVTRNDFGSTAYLSPECLDSGDRDLHTDAWAVGVLLYEMVRGRLPFRAEDTRRLEHLIRSRRPPESIAGCCPPAFEAVIAKLLAPYPADRYGSAREIRADLTRALAGEDTVALGAGWPDAATRRTRPDDVGTDEPATRRTHDVDAAADVPTRPRPSEIPDAPPAGASAAEPPRRRSRFPRALRLAVIFGVLAIGLNESCIASRASRLAETVPLMDFPGLSSLWPEYEALAGRSFMGGAGVSSLAGAISNQTLVLAERVMANYRTPMPTVRENQWIEAREALGRALTLDPRNSTIRAAIRYCDGQVLRINGEANKARGQDARAQQQFTEAVVAFREAAELRQAWPDPFLGLARTFIYGLDDVDKGADALAQAQKYGHHPGDRETVQLADGYRARGEALARTAQTLKGMAQERDYLERAATAYREALTRYSTVSGFGNAAASIRDTQRRLDRVDARLAELTRRGWWPWD